MNEPSDFSSHSQEREQEIARAVRQYLAEHPHAMDTLEGIAEWWITRNQVRVEVELLARVLTRLTDEGVLEEVQQGREKQYRLRA